MTTYEIQEETEPAGAGEPAAGAWTAEAGREEFHEALRMATRVLLAVAWITVGGWLLVFGGLERRGNAATRTLRHDWLKYRSAARQEVLAWSELHGLQEAAHELDAWHRSRIAWSELLDDVVRLQPPDLSLQKVSIQSRLTQIPADDLVHGTGTVVVARQQVFLLQGRMRGNEVGPTMADYVERLAGSNVLGRVSSSVVLQGIARHNRAADSDDARLVGIEAETAARPVW